MSLFRTDLLHADAPSDTKVPRKKHMMCLNESILNPYPLIDEAFNQTMQDVSLNRYFDDIKDTLHKLLTEYVGHGIKEENIIWANGADDMLYNIFLAVREDNDSFALSLAPSYFDYSTFTRAVGLNFETLDFNDDLDFDADKYLKVLNSKNCRLGILCNPNNPTGQLLSDDKILYILRNTEKPVLLDETYFEFSGATMVDRVKDFSNLIIVRSFSKAFSMAGVRFGYMISQEKNTLEIRKAQTVFNVSSLVQAFVVSILLNKHVFLAHTKKAIELTKQMHSDLGALPNVKVMPTQTNFVTFTIGEKTSKLFEYLKEHEIAIRDVGAHRLLKNYLRASCGSFEQNTYFLEQVKNFLKLS